MEIVVVVVIEHSLQTRKMVVMTKEGRGSFRHEVVGRSQIQEITTLARPGSSSARNLEVVAVESRLQVDQRAWMVCAFVN